jgi:hypothetical protein
MMKGEAWFNLDAKCLDFESFAQSVYATRSGHGIEHKLGTFAADYVPKCREFVVGVGHVARL